MKKAILVLLILLFGVTSVFSESDNFKKFKKDYDKLDLDLLNNRTEEIKVTNFIYKKDLATFTFRSGRFFLLRYHDDRPTTAFFIGEGLADFQIPSGAESNRLESISGQGFVKEEFETCFIRMADDLDLKLKELFPSKEIKLKWKDFNVTKQAQGEYFFRPILAHTYDNYFQLLRSVYERNANGFFWIDFNRHTYTYDPNRPNPSIVGYEFEGGDFGITEAVNLPEGLVENIDNSALSNVIYPTTAISKTGMIEMGGFDGTHMKNASITMKVVINADSLKYLSTFLHFNLKLDSITFNGQPLDYFRRKEFNFIGLIFDEYKFKNDTLDITYYYKGKNFDNALPFVENLKPAEISFDLISPRGYNYILPGLSAAEKADKGKQKFRVEPDDPYKTFRIRGYVTGYDTLMKTTDLGLNINFVKSKALDKQYDCFIPHEIYENSIMNGFKFMSSKVGNPIGAFKIDVFPKKYISMPGLVSVPQVLCYSASGRESVGGLDMYTGHSLSKQWFGSLLKPASNREHWLQHGASEYLSLMNIHSNSQSMFYSNLATRRDSLLRLNESSRLRPLSSGVEAGDINLNNKGVWLFHMLRFMMLDIEKGSDTKFTRFFYEMCINANSKTFTNSDIIALAEKYYEQPLDWFFDQWLYDYSYPKFKVDYSFTNDNGQYYVEGVFDCSNVSEKFKMPVVVRVIDKNKASHLLHLDAFSGSNSFKVGPFEVEPDKFYFNDLMSVLGITDMNKK